MHRISMSALAAMAAVLISATAASAADKVTIGVVNASSDAALFVAAEKGFFGKEGIEADFVAFDSGAKMIPPLGAGQLDVGAGGASPGLYNAVERGIAISIVADKARNVPGQSFQALMVRKELAGSIKTLADLKGRKVAITAAGSSDASVLNEAMKSVGLTFNDVEKVYLGFPQHVPAFTNGAIDASITTEPTVTALQKLGVAVRFTENAAFYPNAQTSVILYGGTFAKGRAEVAKRFMKAYLQGIRAFNAAVKDGHLTGPGADEIVAILTKHSNVKDAATVRAMVAHACDPDGRVNADSLRKDLAFFKAQGDVKGSITADQVIDLSFVEAAVKELGPARASR